MVMEGAVERRTGRERERERSKGESNGLRLGPGVVVLNLDWVRKGIGGF